MNSGKSIIISLGGLEDETKRLIGAMVMVAIEQAALSRKDIAERRDFTLLVDEWGSFTAQERTISTILSQCRKFNLHLWLAGQSLSQVSSNRLSGALENCRLMIAFALGRASAEIQAKQIGFADPFAIKEEPTTQTQHSQYQSITDQFESWNQELMNLPTRCCYVKVQGKEAVRITSLNVKDPRIEQRELAEVLGEYKNRYQRSQQDAEDVLKAQEGRKNLYRSVPTQEEIADTVFDQRNQFHNPFAAGTAIDKEKPGR
jgi:type IV secretory pathway TraG/TraD family ATPase VirD4